MTNQNRSLVLFVLLMVSSFISAVYAYDDLKMSMCNDLDFIESVYRTSYAPYEWKKELFNWDLGEQIMLAKSKVEALDPPLVKGYHKILKDFFCSTRDYHVGFTFYSTEEAYLPFIVKGVNNRYYFALIDRALLPQKTFPFTVGDELVSFGGKPTAEVIGALKNEVSASDYPTDTALAELYLTYRTAMGAMDVPQGSIMISVRPKGKTRVIHHQLRWEYYPEEINNDVVTRSLFQTADALSTGTAHSFKGIWINRNMLSPLYKIFSQHKLQDNPHLLGTRESYIPALGKILWKTDSTNPFNAYIYRSNTYRKIGYVRIPHYTGSSVNAQAFAQIIKKFQQETDALVIDEINNPGGSLFYIYALASMLSDQPLFTPREQMTITQEFVFYAVQDLKFLANIQNDDQAKMLIGNDVDGYPVTYQFVVFYRDYCRFIINQWNAGKKLTDPYYIYGTDYVNPYPEIQYTKPILMVVNSLDFSGGDFFPAILQDNKRVTILGTRTAGAGGYVNGLSYPNHFALANFSYTGSIATRVNGQPIENLGVTPDIHYRLTERDLRENYKDYVNAINCAVRRIMDR